jgi:general secretion pathway protein J
MKDNSREAGFTLIEMLVATAMLAIMAIYAISSISTFKEIRRVESRVAEGRSIAAVQRHFEQSLSNAHVTFETVGETDTRIVFTGKSDSVVFVSMLDDRLERGGLHRLHYRLDKIGKRLVLGYEINRPTKTRSAEHELVLLTNVERVKFSYFGPTADDEVETWQAAWVRPDRLPTYVRIDIEFAADDQRSWRPLIVRIEGSV